MSIKNEQPIIELPFTLSVDFMIDKKTPTPEVFEKLIGELSKIRPLPHIDIYLNDLSDYQVLSDLSANSSCPTAFYLRYEEKLKNTHLPDGTNLVFPVNTENLYEKTKQFETGKADIVLEPSIGLNDDQKTQLKKIKNEKFLSNVFLKPYMTEVELERFSKGKENRGALTCAAAWLNPIILANGDVYCCKHCKIGNLLEHSILDLWNNEEANAFRAKMTAQKNLPECKSCLKKYKESFLIVENAELNYKNKTYRFPSELNYVPSAPKVAIIGEKADENTYYAETMPIFADEDINSENLNYILLVLE